MSRLSDDSDAPAEPTLIEPPSDPGDVAPRAREGLEDWLLRTENVRALGLYLGALVLVAALGWGLTFLGVSWWVVAAALMVIVASAGASLAMRRWKVASMVGGALLATLGLGTAATMLLGARGIGPAASLVAAGRVRAGERVAIMAFGAAPADSSLARAAAELARIGLWQSPVVVASPAGALGPHGLALRGDVARAGNGILLRLRLQRDATTLASLQDAIDAPGALFGATDALVRDLRRRIGEPLRSIRNSQSLEQATTPSLEAMEAYADAVHLALAQAPALAIAPARRAVALDSGFALARLLLSDMLIATEAPSADIDVALDAAYRVRDRLPDRMRLGLDVTYYTRSSRRDRGRAIQALQAMLARGDTAPGTLGALADLLVSRREYPRAEAVARRAVAVVPTVASYEPLLASLAAQSRMTALQAAVDQLQRDDPAHAPAVLAPADLLYANGDYDGAIARAESLRAVPDSAVRLRAAALLARLELLRGRVGTWQRAYRDAAPTRPSSPARALMDSALFAFQDAWYFGRNERATQRLDTALAALPLDAIPSAERPTLRLATVYAMAGSATRARRLIEQFTAAAQDTAVTRQSRPAFHRALGEVALAEGRPKLAIVEFYRADSLDDGPAGDPLQTMVDLGRAFNDANEPDSAIVWLERFVNTTRWARDSIDAIYLPRVHGLLAELYDTKGDGPRAMSHYGRFANLWHAADSELMPLVASARRRLTELAREDRP